MQTYGGLAQSVECVVRNDEAPGSKPGFSNQGLVAQWIARWTSDPAVVGSSPIKVVFSGLAQRKRVGLITQRSEDRNLYPLKPSWRSWQRVGLIILRSPVRSWQRAFVHAPVAQSAAHEPYVLRVLGSNPSWSTKGPWCSGSTWDSESHDPGSNPGGPSLLASMAEWSKAFDSSSNIRMNAWVRIPLDAVLTDSMAEWLRRVIRNHMGVARGSSNLSAVVLLFVLQLVSSQCIQNQRTSKARLAQTVERPPFKRMVVGSIPTAGDEGPMV